MQPLQPLVFLPISSELENNKVMDSINVFAPASVANLSCGFDILGLCLEGMGDHFHVKKTAQKGIRFAAIIGQQLPRDPLKNVAGIAALAFLKEHPADCGFEITLQKGIKPGSGIGSSSASAVGIVHALNELTELHLPKEKLLPFAMAGESFASSAAHADNIAPALLGGITLVRSVNPMDIVQIPTPKMLYVAVIHPQIEVKTADARAVLSSTVDFKKSTQQSANLGALISGLFLEDYELIGRSLEDVLVEPKRAQLIPHFHSLKKAALNAGALGAGISGAGPSLFALTNGKETAHKVSQAMARILQDTEIPYQTWVSSINQKGTTTTDSYEI